MGALGGIRAARRSYQASHHWRVPRVPSETHPVGHPFEHDIALDGARRKWGTQTLGKGHSQPYALLRLLDPRKMLSIEHSATFPLSA